jgi:ferritin-like metal-binding protein YciE
MISAVSTGFAKDEHIKNALADYTSENFEIASYRSLIAAAEMLGDHQTAQVCRENLLEEEDMARFLEQQIPMITHEMLQMGAREHGR